MPLLKFSMSSIATQAASLTGKLIGRERTRIKGEFLQAVRLTALFSPSL